MTYWNYLLVIVTENCCCFCCCFFLAIPVVLEIPAKSSNISCQMHVMVWKFSSVLQVKCVYWMERLRGVPSKALKKIIYFIRTNGSISISSDIWICLRRVFVSIYLCRLDTILYSIYGTKCTHNVNTPLIQAYIRWALNADPMKTRVLDNNTDCLTVSLSMSIQKKKSSTFLWLKDYFLSFQL